MLKLKMKNDFELNNEKYHLSTVNVGAGYETLLTKWVFSDPFGKECNCWTHKSFFEAFAMHNKILRALGVLNSVTHG